MSHSPYFLRLEENRKTVSLPRQWWRWNRLYLMTGKAIYKQRADNLAARITEKEVAA